MITVTFCPLGQVYTLDEQGYAGQVPELQENLFILWANHVASLGHDPEKMKVETLEGKRIRFFRTDDSFNYEVTP